MNADCIYRIGAGHAVCQDYCVARGGDDPYVVIADGCSSSPDTDCGARLLVRSAAALLPARADLASDAEFGQAVVERALPHAEGLGLPAQALDATLLWLTLDGGEWTASVHGDGMRRRRPTRLRPCLVGLLRGGVSGLPQLRRGPRPAAVVPGAAREPAVGGLPESPPPDGTMQQVGSTVDEPGTPATAFVRTPAGLPGSPCFRTGWGPLPAGLTWRRPGTGRASRGRWSCGSCSASGASQGSSSGGGSSAFYRIARGGAGSTTTTSPSPRSHWET